MRCEIRSLNAVTALLLALPAAGLAQSGPNGFPAVACDAAVPTSAAVRAQRSLAAGRVAEALEGAQSALRAQPGNPHHHFLHARALASASDFLAADSAFARAAALCPGYAAPVEEARQIAWAEAFRQGMESYQAGDTARAIARWEAASTLSARRPDAWFNLGVVRTARGELAGAADAYRRVLAVLAQLPADSSAAELRSRAETRATALSGLLGVGARLFARNELDQSAELFRYLTLQDPGSRDAWYNYALTLFKRSSWGELVPVADRLTRIDPLNENARIILFNAHRGLAESGAAGSPEADEHRRHALAIIEAADSLPVYVDEIRLSPAAAGAGALTGKVTGNRAAAGQPVTLAFTFWGPDGADGSGSVVVPAPAKGQTAPFRVPLPDRPISSFSYAYR